ncbi:anaphase promoting complex subunit 10 [Heterostelium album PN500]|uniref:Anaphase promoting complex subunit 10 n=1 Tax=Heterostelium pallidum (strain ATCC 26659 / Pp 5 / PN500) TaxID=670386 RepID=D3BU92_HETP5|nr:anaphase promoting complex subunit 10 [Heterostelium album PN500]EFA75026.1 anaphase promoting complex subunit 10 [Heterostelium album PN500]|eukprot:XP_020427160.1 anaphase promoting complex subunit 10 [Heterostelium album PN500]
MNTNTNTQQQTANNNDNNNGGNVNNNGTGGGGNNNGANQNKDQQILAKESIDSIMREFIGLVDIGKNATWTLSSAKPGFGIEQLLDENLSTYWQSDAPQPHTINIQFNRRYEIESLLLYTDFKEDESYTPSKISIKIGSTFHDLEEIINTDLEEPNGWINIPLLNEKQKPLRANLLQISIIANHQNGRDTHVRQIKVLGKKVTLESKLRIPNFSQPEFNFYNNIR